MYSNHPNNLDLYKQMVQSNHWIASEFSDTRKFIKQQCAHIRRKQTNHCITCGNDGNLFLAQFYDDNSCEAFHIFNNLPGAFEIYTLEHPDVNIEKKYFGIHFPQPNIWIVGETNKLSAQYLYNLFVEQNFSFVQSLSKAKVQRGLYEFFTPRIMYCENVFSTPGLAGWYCQKFHHNETMLCTHALKQLPIASKKLELLPIENLTISMYREFINGFSDEKNRLLIALFPIVALLGSIFKEFDSSVNFSINLIPTIPVKNRDIAEYFQIFSRDTCAVYPFNCSRKNIENILSLAKDETLIFDFRLSDCTDYYRIKLRKERIELICNVLFDRISLPFLTKSVATAGLVTICDEPILKPNIFNIIISSEFDIGYSFHHHNVMSRIYSSFVRYIEKTYDDFYVIFTRNTKSKSHAGKILEIAYTLFRAFWKTYNFDFDQGLNFAKEFDFDQIIPEVESVEEDINIFLNKIVENVNNYVIVPKNSSSAGSNSIFYDDNFLYIPECLFAELCLSFGLKDYRQYLLMLRKQGDLFTSQDRLLKHIIVNHQTIACYVFKREIFRHVGQIDIINFGKERQ